MRSALNLVCWQCTWLTVIHSASNGLFWPGCLVFAASIPIQSTRRFGVCLPPAGLVAGVVVAGLVVDSVLMSSGLIRFPVDEGAGWPAWMALLWANWTRRFVGPEGDAWLERPAERSPGRSLIRPQTRPAQLLSRPVIWLFW